MEQKLQNLDSNGFVVLKDTLSEIDLDSIEYDKEKVIENKCFEFSLTSNEYLQQQGCIVDLLDANQVDSAVKLSYKEYLNARKNNYFDTKTPSVNVIVNNQSIMSIIKAYFQSNLCYLFNEQFIIKPPTNDETSSFNWHKDSDSLVKFLPNLSQLPSYISVWICLTSTSSKLSNGTLVFEGKEPLDLTRGDVVILKSGTIHKSLPNYSNNVRSAYMVQFSKTPIKLVNNSCIAFAAQLHL